MIAYRVIISGFQASYTERWEARSREEAERKARQRWQREFGDAGAYRFFATPTRGKTHDDDDD